MTHSKTVKIGMVGTSWWADAMYLPAIEAHPSAQTVAICGRDADRTRQTAAQWNIPAVYTDYYEMLTEADLDAVIISSGNDTHYPFTLAAIERGLHVICEKPLAMHYTQAKHMAEAAAERGIKHMTPFTYSFMPTTRYLKELISGGYIGKPYHLNMRYYAGFGRDGSHYQWRFDLAKAGVGVVGDLGSHFLYLATWLFDSPVKRICVQLGHMVERPNKTPDGQLYDVADDSAVMLLSFENGAQGVIQVSSLCYEGTAFGQTHHMDFHGSGGTLYSFTDWDSIQRVSGTQAGGTAAQELPIPDHIWGAVRRDTVHNTYRDVFRVEDHMARGFINAILDDTSLRPTFEDGATIQRVIEAAQRSHKTGCWVDVSSIE